MCSIMACTTSTPEEENQPKEEIALVNVNILPMTGDFTILEKQTIIIRDGKIHQIGAVTQIKPSEGATVINGKGQYVLPGLAEMHAHIPVAEEGNDTLVKETLFLYLSQGITTIRGMLGNPYHLELKEKVQDGEILGPRIYTSSPSMNGNSVQTEEEAAQKVRQYKEDGYDFLKIHPGIKLSVMEKLVATAKEVDIVFAGHVPSEVGVERALNYGYGTIDHLDGFITALAPEGSLADNGGFFGFSFTDYLDTNKINQLAQLTKSNGVAIVPTLTLFTRWISPEPAIEMLQEREMKYMPARIRFQWRSNKERMLADENYSAERQAKYVEVRQQLMRALNKAGVTFLLGSDAPQVFNVPGFSLLHEMEAMADAGLSNEMILKSGTSNPADYFDASGEYGVVKVGATADLLMVNANPLDDISNIRKQVGVMVRGQWLSRAYIEQELYKIAQRNQ